MMIILLLRERLCHYTCDYIYDLIYQQEQK